MRHRSPLLAWLAAGSLTVALAGCGLFDQDDAPARSTTTVAATTTTAPSGPKLLEAGAEPRTALRLRFTPGQTATVALTLDLDVDQESSGHRQRLNDPPVTEAVRFTVERADADGATVSFAFTDVSFDRTGSGLTDAEALTLTAELRDLIGLGGSGHVDARGTFSGFRYDLPKGLDPAVAGTLRQAADQFQALAVPFPAEPVGVGARWEVATTADLGGIETTATTTYEVTAIEGDVVTYRATSTQGAEPQAVHLATLPAGAKARLVSATTTATTTGTLDLTSVVATSTYRSTGTQVIDVTQGSQPTVRLTQQLTAVVGVKPAG